MMTVLGFHAPHKVRAGHLPTVGAVEVVRVVGIIPEHEGLLINDQVAPLTDVLTQALGLLPVVARPTEVSVGDKGSVSGRSMSPAPPPRTARPCPGEESPGCCSGRAWVLQREPARGEEKPAAQSRGLEGHRAS